MSSSCYLPIYLLTRGETIESVHYGAVAVVDVSGNLVAWYGDPNAVTFLRSSAKPFQVMPLFEQGGKEAYDLTNREIAIMCSSHSGTDEQFDLVQSIQEKIGVHESNLLCGVHYPLDENTAERMRKNGVQSTPNRNNCSGMHTSLLGHVEMMAGSSSQTSEGLTYIDPNHPVQKEILASFAGMCNMSEGRIAIGIDGCSLSSFGVPLRIAALAYARLCDPEAGEVLPTERASACHTITDAMTSNPEMVGGPDRFDTRLMVVAGGRIVAKGGAEGFQGVGLMPGVMGSGSKTLGVAIKISDGDARGSVCSAVTLEVLHQLEALSPGEMADLAEFGPGTPVHNLRNIKVGQARPSVVLEYASG
ncbi:asparaginase [Chloroflexota bacterium]